MAQRVGPLASGPARMAVLAGRSHSCLRDRSTHSGNLQTSKENEGKAIRRNPGSSNTHKLERQACQRVSLGNSGNWLFVGRTREQYGDLAQNSELLPTGDPLLNRVGISVISFDLLSSLRPYTSTESKRCLPYCHPDPAKPPRAGHRLATQPHSPP